MFAVPGWNVSTAHLGSTESGDVPARSSLKDPPDRVLPSLNSKKRKRGLVPESQGRHVSAEELEQLWGSQFKSQRKGLEDSQKKLNQNQKQKKNSAKKPGGNDSSIIAKSQPSGGDVSTRKEGKQTTEGVNYDQSPTGLGNKGLVNRTPPSKLAESRSSSMNASSSAVLNISKKRHSSAQTSNAGVEGATKSSMLPPAPPPASSSLTPLQATMRDKLTAARFRHLNETLYSSTSADAFELFSKSPELFAEYHAGFSQQVKDSWPQNPVDQYVRDIKERGGAQHGESHGLSRRGQLLPRRKTGRCTIADLGCGDAPLARGCQSVIKSLNLKLHNFDLHAPNNFVTTADIANLPLRDSEVDIAVFCLSLMGTNWTSFVEEAWRVLRGDGKGELWISEVKSRFGRVSTSKAPGDSVSRKKKSNNLRKYSSKPESESELINGQELFAEDDNHGELASDETDVSAFVNVLQRRGFILREDSINKSNKMFVSLVFLKSGVPAAGKHRGLKWNGYKYERVSDKHSGRMKFLDQAPQAEISVEDEAQVLKPCLYKTR